MNSDLLEIICCPETKQTLRPLEREVLRSLNKKIREGSVKNRGGEVVTERLDGALIREDGTIIYPIKKEIPILLIHEAIEL
ncbi:MAG: Trm112 family protein [Fibrobacterota bacterium]